ncbi:MAG: EAL domain-containing protein [Pseudomonadota bacterium]
MTDSVFLGELWRLFATLLVLGMQAGFLLLEAGSVRAKNTVNVAQKNVTDLAICWSLFLVLGFWIAFGLPSPIWTSASITALSAPLIDFMFQLAFCGAAATIIAGAVAERMRFVAYAWLTVVVVAFIYPLIAWLCWGNLFINDRAAPLADAGFVDFAGGTVVHGTSAAVALAAIVILGPRDGRFDANGAVRPIPGNSPVLSLLGLIVLLVGWFGFNAGALNPDHPRFATTIMATASAGCFGALVGLLLGCRLDGGIFNPTRSINGVLGGLVAVTAGAGFADVWHATLLGCVGGALALLTSDWLTKRMRLDDPLDVVAVHGAPGLLGTVAVAWMLPTSELVGGSVALQAAVQLGGGVICFVVCFVCAITALRAIRVFTPLRVSAQDEYLGLNFTEHGVSIDTQRLKRALDSQLANGAFDDSLKVDNDLHDDASELAESLNALLNRHEQARTTIQSQAKRFQHFASTTADVLWETDSELTITYFKGRSASHDSRIAERMPELFDLFICSRQDRLGGKNKVSRQEPLGSFRARLDYGGTLGERIFDVTGVPYFDNDGRLLGYRGGANDITERQIAQERASYLAFHDELTGLGNRRSLAERLADSLSEADAQGEIVVVAAIDLDGFKEVNDAYGHATGDQLLEAVAQRLRDSIRSGDDIYRTGGDEFVAVLTGFDETTCHQDAGRWCQRIIDALQEPFGIETLTISVGASIGISLFPHDSRAQQDLVRMADIAMYQAKVNGKGHVIPFDASMDEEAQRRRELESALHTALEERQFFMSYQPKYSIQSNSLIGFEALVRWQHPERGELAPGEFLPALDHLQLMPELGEYVLGEACQFAATWPDYEGIHVAVNVSPHHLTHPGFFNCVQDALAQSGLEPTRLELEVTEEVLITDFAQAQRVLERISALGVKIAVDDFGKGSTSLRYLQQFPLDKLKIDKSFIRNIASDPKAREIARSVVQLGHHLGLVVTAEGVEESDQLQQLSEWNCDEAQGFLFSRPVDKGTVTGLLDPKGEADSAAG